MCCLVTFVGAALVGPLAVAHDPIDAILKIERGGQGVAEARTAAEQLLEHDVDLDRLLAKAGEANPVSKNWILSLAGTIADRLPRETAQQALERFLADQSGDGEARYWAFDRLASGDSGLRERMLEGRTEDSSLDIRYEAIELALQKLPSTEAATADENTKMQAIDGYRNLLKAARLPQQINHIAARLKELGEEADLKTLLGFVSNWHAVGTFDNRNGVGFAAVYPPESDYIESMKLDTSRQYSGKNGETSWHAATTDKPDGKVDLNPLFNSEKGAAAYAYAVVESPENVTCQVRLGSPNANKVWINGVEVTANNVYHNGSQIDQYIASASLKQGKNTVLVKICQNEQTEPSTLDFSFQLRFTDATGAAIRVAQ